jgi:hypothetical protein
MYYNLIQVIQAPTPFVLRTGAVLKRIKKGGKQPTRKAQTYLPRITIKTKANGDPQGTYNRGANDHETAGLV